MKEEFKTYEEPANINRMNSIKSSKGPQDIQDGDSSSDYDSDYGSSTYYRESIDHQGLNSIIAPK